MAREATTMNTDITMTLSTFPTREKAQEVGRALVERRLAACVQISSQMISIYSWKGEIHEDPEYLLFIKTTAGRTPDVIKYIREVHPYEIPEIITTPVISGFDGYIDWVKASTC